MKVNERRVRELAYQIWESEGRPEGQHDRHWRMARSLAEAEAGNVDGTQEPVKPRFEGTRNRRNLPSSRSRRGARDACPRQTRKCRTRTKAKP
ncbi:DUF2934 domain-containing protein [Pseudomonas denitrificans (nom. rej.)]|uniref:DUF2934 domain-containing protein n=1 Tax=Pseudomonas denitrificans TaxID=43306 RepID=A0A9X7MYC9_PSEDE|nr:DUF2934 domain-containing protein [Pseudomonas denitrificans (nom. rej.)]